MAATRSSSSSAGAHRRSSDPRGHRRLQRGGLRLDRQAARLAARAEARSRARRRRRRFRGRAPKPPRRTRSGSRKMRRTHAAARAAGRARHASAPRCWRTSSTITGARPSRSGGRTSIGRRSRSTICSTTRRRSPTWSRWPDVAPEQVKQSLVHTLRFPDQEFKLAPDPRRRLRIRFGRSPRGTIAWLDAARGRLGLKRGPKRADEPLPSAIVAGEPLDTRRAAATRSAASRTRSSRVGAGLSPPSARCSRRELPRVRGVDSGASLQTLDLAEQKALVAALDDSYLFIQGPPGSGKTWTGARLIVSLIASGKRVGVAANSHKAIHNLLDGGRDASRVAEGVTFRRAEEGQSGDDRVRRPVHRATRTTTRSARAVGRAADRRHVVALRARGDGPARSTTCSSTKPARSRWPTRSRWAPPRATSCCSAIRSSCRRSRRAFIPRAPAAPCSSICSASASHRRRGSRPVPRAHRGGCIRTCARSSPTLSYDGRLVERSRPRAPAHRLVRV